MLEPLNSFTTSAADFADKPNSAMSSAEVKAQFDAAPEELRVFVNRLIDQLNADFALKSEIATALLGQVLDGSLTDLKLSNNVGQVKDRLSKVITDSADFIATKGLANGLAPLDTTGVVPDVYIKKGLANGVATLDGSGNLVQKPYVVGTYTGNGNASRAINLGFTPQAVLLVDESGATSSSGASSGGLAVTGVNVVNAGKSILTIEPGGFTVFFNQNTSPYAYTNNINTKYMYIAYR